MKRTQEQATRANDGRVPPDVAAVESPGGGHVRPEAVRGAAPEDSPAVAATADVMRHSWSGAVWTVFSRLTGLGKTVTIGAVLGATYLGNTYQAINALPNLVYYQLLAGSLFASLLVPPLVGRLDHDDRAGAQVLVDGFFGCLLLLAAGACGLLLAAGPVILRLLSLGVPDAATAASQQRVGWLLLVLFAPQIALYVVAGTGAAVMNACGRFALAAAAPALESLGMVTVLVGSGVVFGTGTSVTHVATAHLLVLGFGTTSAVGLHAACQWWGARSAGLRLRARAGWRDPAVRALLRRIPPTLGFTGLAALQIFAVSIVANRVAGGLVTFQLALNFFYLPTAVVTWPIARALLPQLARLHQAGDERGFRSELARAVAVASFVTVPIAVAYVGLAVPLAHALAFGQLGSGAGWKLTAVSLAALAPGVVAETWFILGTYASYARHDVRSVLRSMSLRVGVSLALMLAAWTAHGPAVLIVLGVALSGGSLLGAVHIGWRLRGKLPGDGVRLVPTLTRSLVASSAMLLSARGALWWLHGFVHNKLTELLVLAVAGIVGVASFAGIQAACRAPELGLLKAGLARNRKTA
jgi:putative peptidoglycan lipid II flippase